MEYLTEATYTHAKNGCYRHEANREGVDFDVAIPGEGTLFLCAECILEAGRGVRIGRARRIKRDKAEAAVRAQREAV